MDATIIAAPSSTKNASKTRDPEMKQTRKGKQWHFGMKLHIGTDRQGRVHTSSRRPRRAPTSRSCRRCCTATRAVLYGDQAYWKEADRQAYEARGVRYRVNRRARSRHHPLSERWRKINRARSRTRARCEHPFYVVKQLWGFAKVRYRGLAKNLARAHILFGLANLYHRPTTTSPGGGSVSPVSEHLDLRVRAQRLGGGEHAPAWTCGTVSRMIPASNRLCITTCAELP